MDDAAADSDDENNGSGFLSHESYRIALYYCYVGIADPTKHCEFHASHCKRLALGGRIRVAPEGINGVLSGLVLNLEEYERELREELDRLGLAKVVEEHFELDVKYCQLRPDLPASVQLFDSLSAKATQSVVSLVGTSLGEAKRSNRRSRQRQSGIEQSTAIARTTERILANGLKNHRPAIHLSPEEWDRRLNQVDRTGDSTEAQSTKTVLLDCRNVYESSVGYFHSPGADTVLTNTRKYSELPQVLLDQAERLEQSDEIFMYCTGGVRCEPASVFLQSLLAERSNTKSSPQIYQLHGGIQRYLESNAGSEESLYKGKNFVFDPRRTDPVHNAKDHTVGKCLVCNASHDDFDNGASPSENREARCWNCRILVLVCDACRLKVSCWNEDNGKPRVYCQGLEGECYHMPPVKIIPGDGSMNDAGVIDSPTEQH